MQLIGVSMDLSRKFSKIFLARREAFEVKPSHPQGRERWKMRKSDGKKRLNLNLYPYLGICQNKVHCLFKEVFGITQDTNFIVHQPVPVDNVQAYEHEDGPGPNSDKPAFDLSKNHTSPWNAEVIKVGQSSLVMAILEVKARMLAHLEKLGKESHQATRCHNKYKRRMAVLNYVVQLRMEVSNDDLTAWKWLQRLVKTLGEQGISSKESAVENEIEQVLHIKRMEWRCCIDHELDIINVEQVLDDNIFSP
ncbi:hypothetical protein EV401DRAFT_1893978 [Pisolithus croceorrhizus]|nr:hypothetical protein EV401DRAFT_1893978 [Pisolithus croceorrhizus]